MTDRVFSQANNIVSVSGGKDSTALLIMAAIEEQVPNMYAVFADTGHEKQEVYDYLDYLEETLSIKIWRVRQDFSRQIAQKREYIKTHWADDGVPQSKIDDALSVLHPTGIPMLDLCLWKGRFPSSQVRFCTEHLKRNAIQQQVVEPIIAHGEAIISWQGVRADESRNRRYLLMRDVDFGAWGPHDPWGLLIYRPILQWTAAEVFDYHRKHGINWNPLYEKGMGRVGCMPCVNARKEELQEIARRFPGEIERVAEWERLVSLASKRGSATFFTSSNDPTASDDAHYSTHGIHSMVEWSKTVRGGRQYDLIASTTPDSGCSSSYGLCDTED